VAGIGRRARASLGGGGMTATPTAGVLGGVGSIGPPKGAATDRSGVDGPRSQASREAASNASSAPLGGLVMRGSAWTMGGYAISQVLRLGSNLALTHILVEPRYFGLMALVMVFIQGLTMFSDLGIGASIVQSDRGDDARFLNSAWTVQVLRGLALWACTLILAYPLSVFYGEPLLVWMLPVVGLNVLISGFNSTSLFTMSRKLALGRLTLLALGSQIISTAVIIVWALASPSVWALVAGGVVSQIIYLIASHAMRDGDRERFALDRESLRSLSGFGKWIFLSTVITFMVGQGDRLIFGKLMPIEVLGVYSIALMLATFSSQAVFTLGSSVLFPAYSQRVRSGLPLAPVFEQVRTPLAVLAGFTVAGLIAAGPALINLLWPASFGGAAWMVQPLAAAALIQAMECTNGSALLALGQARWVAAGSAAKLVGMVLLIPIGYVFGGFPGAVGGLVASEVLRYLVSVLAVGRFGLPALSGDVLVLTWAGATAAGGYFLGPVLENHGVRGWERMLVQCAAVSVLWLPLLVQQGRRVRRRFNI